MSINERLEAYRRKKRREKMTETIKSAVMNAFPWNRNDRSEKSARELTKDEEVRLYRIMISTYKVHGFLCFFCIKIIIFFQD